VGFRSRPCRSVGWQPRVWGSAPVFPYEAAHYFSKVAWMLSRDAATSAPRAPPKSGRAAVCPPAPRRANCVCPSQTSCRSLHRWTKASIWAKMDELPNGGLGNVSAKEWSPRVGRRMRAKACKPKHASQSMQAKACKPPKHASQSMQAKACKPKHASQSMQATKACKPKHASHQSMQAKACKRKHASQSMQATKACKPKHASESMQAKACKPPKHASQSMQAQSRDMA
jgi:hypothetical protein